MKRFYLILILILLAFKKVYDLLENCKGEAFNKLALFFSFTPLINIILYNIYIYFYGFTYNTTTYGWQAILDSFFPNLLFFGFLMIPICVYAIKIRIRAYENSLYNR